MVKFFVLFFDKGGSRNMFFSEMFVVLGQRGFRNNCFSFFSMRFSFHEPQSFVQKGTIDFHFLSMSHKVLFKNEQSHFQFLSMSHKVLFNKEQSATQFCPSATKCFSPGKFTLQSKFPWGNFKLIRTFSKVAAITSVGLIS